MEQCFVGQKGNKYILKRGRKYTKLYLNHSLFMKWTNDVIDNILKSDFYGQVEYFKKTLV